MNRLLTLLFVIQNTLIAAEDDYHCLREPKPFVESLQHQAYEALDRRRQELQSLQTPADVREYQMRRRAFFLEQLGGFPLAKPDLNSLTVKSIQADGYRIENVIFDSLPNHRVTANLYLPAGQGPFPGVVVASGHSRTAKTADYNQRFALMMVRCGMAALCFDPIGQGERSQILNERGTNRLSGTTTEHLLIGVGSALVGRNTATFEVWDAMRAIDYLQSRPEIDPDKIGMTGCSGGGTQTSYAMALDDRIKVAAPACYITTFRRLIETIGPQDSEQNVFGQITFGLDQPDYVLMRAPQPTLISATTGDFFPIEGTWEAFRQAKRVYGLLGLPERVDLVEGPGKHGVPAQNLATIGQWMRRWLLELDQPVAAVEILHRPQEDLMCTEHGQVLSLPEERSVFDLNVAHAARMKQERAKIWARSSADEMRKRIADKLQLANAGDDSNTQQQELIGTIKRNGYVIEKYVLQGASQRLLPTLVFRPERPDGAVCLYLHADGKAAGADAGGEIAAMAKSGTIVVTLDLSGQGETAAGKRSELHGDWKTFNLAYLLGKSLVGIRVEDTFVAAQFAKGLQSNSEAKIDLIGVAEAGIIALHAAALRPNRFQSLRVPDTPVDWSSIVGESLPPIGLDYVVPGALELYDLTDLKSLSAQQSVR